MSRKKPNGQHKTPIGDFVPNFLKDAILARWDDVEAREKWPNLFACLAPVYEGATLRRQAGRITFKIIGPNLIASLTNPSELIDVDIVVTSLTAAFDEIEQSISTGNFHVKPGWQKNRKKPPTILDDLVQ